MTSLQFLKHEVHRPRKAHGAALVGTIGLAPGAALVPGPAMAAESDTDSAPPAQVFQIDGTDKSIETNLPWKAVSDRSGELEIYVGPGAPDADVSGEVLDLYRGEASGSKAKAAAATWYCTAYQTSPTRSGNQMKAYVGLTCYDGAPSSKIHWQFERNGVSLTGWVRYSDEHTTSWTPGGTQGTDVYAHCNTSDGRTRNFTTYMRGEFTGGYFYQ